MEGMGEETVVDMKGGASIGLKEVIGEVGRIRVLMIRLANWLFMTPHSLSLDLAWMATNARIAVSSVLDRDMLH